MKKYLPALVWYEPFEPFGYAFIRFGTGAILAAHGVGRLFYGVSTAELGVLKGLSASTIGGFELAAGVLLALGLLTRPVALLFALEWLAIALATPVRPPATNWFMQGATPHYPAFVAAFCLAFLLRGGGHYSLGRAIDKEF